MLMTLKSICRSLIALIAGFFIIYQTSFAQALSKQDEDFVDACVLKLAKERGLMLSPQLQIAYDECVEMLQKRKTGSATRAISPSFDCGKASTKVEKLICSNPELSQLDASLAETYKEALAKDRSVLNDQRAWNTQKNKCPDVECLKTAYEDRRLDLTNFIVRHDRAALNAGQASANASNSGGQESGLDFLFKQGGYWVDGEAPAGLSCNAILAQENFGTAFKRFTANQTEILIRIGGRHPSRGDPGVASQMNRNINVSTQYAVIQNTPTTRIKVSTRAPNGAIIEDFLELSPQNNTVVKYGVGECSGCDQAQLRVRQNFSEPKVMQWCSGNIGASQTQSSASPPSTSSARPAPPREQPGEAIKVSTGREWVKGWGRYVKYLNIQSASNDLTLSKVVMNRGNCQFRYATTARGGVNLPARVQFGDTVKVDIDHCDLIEAEITTNFGTATYSFRN